MKKSIFFILFTLFFLTCFANAEDPDLSGKWFGFIERDGILVYRLNYDCMIQNRTSWSFVQQDGKIMNSGNVIFAEKSMFLVPKKINKDKNTENKGKEADASKNIVSGIPVLSHSAAEFRIADSFSENILVFKPEIKQTELKKNVCGSWKFLQKNLATKEEHKANFKITFLENGTFSVEYNGVKDASAPEKGTYKFQNGFVILDTTHPESTAFWNKPVFFFDGHTIVLNRQDAYVYGKKE